MHLPRCRDAGNMGFLGKRGGVVLLIVGLLLAASGCGRQNRADLTFYRGVEALAKGSPRSSIPFFSQVVASRPEAPEPRAMLAMAYALDLQPDLAIKQAGLVHRNRKRHGPPGWECVAMGIAALSQHNPSRAVNHFEKIRSTAGTEVGMKRAVTQWLTLALLLEGNDKVALDLLGSFSDAKAAHTTALLWSVLIHGHRGSRPEAAKGLREVAEEMVGQGRLRSLQAIDVTEADDQYLCDIGIAAIRQGELARAERLFMALHRRNANACDAQVWLALLAATQGKWNQVRDRLHNGCQEGPLRSRSLANQLCSIICALDGRPHTMIQHLLAGCRLAGRNHLRIQVPG